MNDEQRDADIERRLKEFEPELKIEEDVDKLFDAVLTFYPDSVIIPINAWVKCLTGGEHGSQAKAMIGVALKYKGYVLPFIYPAKPTGYGVGLCYGTALSDYMLPFGQQSTMAKEYVRWKTMIETGGYDEQQ